MPASETALVSCVPKLLSYALKPVRYCWYLFRDRVALRIEFPEHNRNEMDGWPVPVGPNQSGLAEFTIINSTNHEIEVSTIRVCYAAPLQLRPIAGDTLFRGGLSSGVSDLPFCIEWRQTAADGFTLDPLSQFGLGIEAEFGDVQEREIMIQIVGTNLRTGMLGFLKRGQSQKFRRRFRIFRSDFGSVGGLPVLAAHTLVVPQKVIAEQGGRITGGPSIVQIHEIDCDGNASSRAAYVNHK
jgi:hypothetical protein